MRWTKGQVACAVLTLAAATFLSVYPPWQQAAEKEVAYRKDIGRGLVWRLPIPIAVDCYFVGCVGCVTAPASYFHVLLNRRLLLQRSLTVLCVGLAFLWVFRIRRDGTASSVKSVKTRTAASLLLALLVPPGGDVPLGAALLGAPTLLVHRGGAWPLPLVLVLSLYCACAVVIYYLLTLSVRLLARESRYVAQL